MFSQDGSAWVYSYGEGILHYDGKDWKLKNQEAMMFAWDSSEFVISPKNKVWVADALLYEYIGKGWKAHPYFYPLHQAYSNCSVFPKNATIAQDDSLWYLANCGEIYRFDGTHWSHFDKQKDLGGINITKILPAPDGSLWFFSADGWARYQP